MARLQGEVAGTILCIWKTSHIKPAKKWVDYISIFQFPSPQCLFLGHFFFYLTYHLLLRKAKNLITPLGIPEHQEKGQPFGDSVKYLGFIWDIPHNSVILMTSKKHKYLSPEEGR
ncbi:hypothetical protein PAXRUDRAFT_19944 [Paxillus rubicundulus Ve08.2h10]|uniref:Uncharacterized protein n=1 Tax=Paxillus rubicundulus Ve08.2h10 TaxID=930991 RepID=A0A0D0D349_9AGAM|nr:hypothetical protein PAXRUDRAFT_19944 [Paxillus rubicundulus Ve08.2h10]